MKMTEELSDKSKAFIEDLRVYLFSSGKNSGETEEIIEELKTHLIEAERKGKSVEKIIGNSPKAYMQSIAEEMGIDYRIWFKYILIIIFGSFALNVASDLMDGELAYSVLEIVGHSVIVVFFMVALFAAFRSISGKNFSGIKQLAIIFIPVVLPIALFMGLIYLNRAVDTPVIHFGFWGSLILAVVISLVLVGISIWSRTWILIVVLLLLTVPDYLLRLTSFQQETQLIWSTIIMFGGFGIYFWIVTKLEKKAE